MALRKMVQRLTKPVEELDREKLIDFCADLGATQIDKVAPRTRARVAGEIRSVRIVPRAGAPALEVTLFDGHGAIVGVFLGRRRIVGLSPGRRMVMEGAVAEDSRRTIMYNPIYELR
jgi:hypothetical protein